MAVYISLREAALTEARALKSALEAENIIVYMWETPELGDNLDILRLMDKSALMVVMGTELYGELAPAEGLCTLDELEYMQDMNKPVFLVKMCKAFLDNFVIDFMADRAVATAAWALHAPIPVDLVREIATYIETTVSKTARKKPAAKKAKAATAAIPASGSTLAHPAADAETPAAAATTAAATTPEKRKAVGDGDKTTKKQA
jgi:hypothetical protein